MVIYLSCLWLILFLDYSRENTCHSTFFNNLILVSYILVLRFAVGHFVVIRLLSQSVRIVGIVRVVGSVRRVGRVESVTLSCGTIAVAICGMFHCGNCHRTVDAKPSILRTRLVPSKFIRRQKSTETAEENKVEQATVRFKEVEE